MSEGEFLVGALALVGALFAVRQVFPLVTLPVLVTPVWMRAAALGIYAIALLVVHATMLTLSASDVRESALYIGYYDLLGFAWLGAVVVAMHWLDLSLRDDVFERRNVAALVAFAGILIGHAFAYAGGNIGDGPGWWCVVIASGLGCALLFGVWWLLHAAARVPHAITVERDVLSGARTGALLLACGLVFGRAAAGDWISVSDTILSFANVAWPALGIVIVALIAERALAPGREVPRRAALSAMLSVSYLAGGVAIVYLAGEVV